MMFKSILRGKEKVNSVLRDIPGMVKRLREGAEECRTQIEANNASIQSINQENHKLTESCGTAVSLVSKLESLVPQDVHA